VNLLSSESKEINMKSINENYILIEYIRHSLANEELNLESEENLNEGLSDFLKRKAQIAMLVLPALGVQLSNIGAVSANPNASGSSSASYSSLTELEREDLDNILKYVSLKHKGSNVDDANARYFTLKAFKEGYSKKQIQEYLEGSLPDLIVKGKRPADSEEGWINTSDTTTYEGDQEAVDEVTDLLMTDEYKEIKNEIGKKFTDYYEQYEDLLMNNSSNDKSLLGIYNLLKHAANTFKERNISADQVYCLLIVLSGGDTEYELLTKKDLRGLQQAGTSDLKKSTLNKMISFFHGDIKGLKNKDKIKEIKSILDSPVKLTAVLNMLAFRKSLTSSSNSGKFLKAISPILNTIVKTNSINNDSMYKARQKSPGYKSKG
jgi:hypothetical protein